MNKVRLSEAAANAAADAVARLLDGGWINIYEGTMPASADEAPPQGTKLLASIQFASPAFMASEGGMTRAHALQPDRDAAQTGRPQWYRLYRADHVTAVQDGNVAGSGQPAMLLRALLIAQHAEVSVDTFMLKMPKTAAEAQ
jgi:hypothetical protein